MGLVEQEEAGTAVLVYESAHFEGEKKEKRTASDSLPLLQVRSISARSRLLAGFFFVGLRVGVGEEGWEEEGVGRRRMGLRERGVGSLRRRGLVANRGSKEKAH
mgnify:FL=1